MFKSGTNYSRIKKFWKEITSGSTGIVIYAILGIIAAFALHKFLAFALQTDLPVVAVVSSSMQHDNPSSTFYGWLETNLGYKKSYIDSWPFSSGFLIGDMPIVRGDSNINVGDVIVYSVQNQNVPIIHRVIKINPDGTYQTKGDNNNSQLSYEKSVSNEQVHGKVIFIIPKLGYFKVFATKLFGVF